MATADKTIRFVVSAAASMPSWYPATPGTIINLSSVLGDASTQVSAAIAVGADAYPAPTYNSARLDPYSGGALVYENGRPFLHCYGGGHDDGSWNGTIKYGPLFGSGSEVPTWSLGAAASPLGSVIKDSSTGLYADGLASAQHTYNFPIGVGSRLWMPAFSGIYSNPMIGGPRSPYYYDTATGTWTFYSQQFPVTGGAGAGGCGVHYNGRIYFYHGAGFEHPLKIFDIATSTWSVEPNAYTFTYGDSAMGAVDTRRGALLVHGSSAGANGVYWPSLTPPYAGRLTGRARPPSTSTNSMEYDYDRDAFVVPVANSLSVYECSASALAAGGDPAWTTRTFSGATPSVQSGTGTKGRFRAIPEMKGYINVPTYNSPVFFYRAA